MKPTDTLEVWQRGPVEGVPGLLQPVAHALLQALEEVEREMENFPATLLWNKPAGVAAVGFHLQHLTGVLDRLFTYARDEMLSPEQLKALTAEGQVHESVGTELLVKAFRGQVQKALDQIRNTPEETLLQPRGVGRKQIPSNVLGLLFHAAEHSQRHVGQLIVTARILRAAQVD
jgi:hypothetical protein